MQKSASLLGLGDNIAEDNTALKFTILDPCLKITDFESLLERLITK